ncbi:hypothetical protein L2W58_00890 [Dethiosulfovibrio sp. F2B]|uniref:hypothetical protein n=1 Tax=Dethiosulfovibrio faecalis TaxID=2720018 RepID=UPI001F2A6D2A|nr:hypothetical protein [Dethiosulfovibrio faecalis]MCF4150361.1 hypothetical protein [Dethiosulfovibrio faecalis]
MISKTTIGPRARGFALALAVFFLAESPSFSASPWKLAVTDPCLASMASFLGGVNLSVVPLSGWDDGKFVRYRIKRDDMPDRALCLDRSDGKKYGLSLESAGVAVLYSDFPADRPTEEIFSDPASLPFMGQRVLVAIADLDPDGYSYYQRRLAEFQSRLDSTVSMGRQLLRGARVLSLSGSSDLLFSAAGCVVESPTGDMVSQLAGILPAKKDSGKKDLVKILTSWKEGYDAVLVDHLSDPTLIDVACKISGFVWMDPLTAETDPVEVLNDRYLALWNVLRSKEK